MYELVHVCLCVSNSLERVHPEGHIHARAVWQECSESCFFKQPKDQNLIPVKGQAQLHRLFSWIQTHTFSTHASWTHFMPCWNTELRLVLQMMTSAHCTTTILTKNAVWHVNSTIFLCSYVCGTRTQHLTTCTFETCIWRLNTYDMLKHKIPTHCCP